MKLKEMKNKSESQEHGRETSKVVILGDSLLKFARGMYEEWLWCSLFPGK